MKKTISIVGFVFSCFVLGGCFNAEESNFLSTTKNKSDLKLSQNKAQNSQNSASQNATSQNATAQDIAAQQKAQAENNLKNNLANNMDNSELVKKYKAALIKTNFGNMKVKFYGEDSPITVGNFLKLSQDGFYNGTKFHRVIKDFMIQGGDPNSKDDDWSNDGTGGPDYKFQDEFNSHKLVEGSLAMANSGPNTNGSQFFIVTAKSTPWLDGKHTNFGEIEEGMDVVKKIEDVKVNENDHPTEDVIVESIELLEK